MPIEAFLFIVVETVILIIGIAALIKTMSFGDRCPNCKKRLVGTKTGEVRRTPDNTNLEEEYQCQECGHKDWKPFLENRFRL